MSSRESNDVLIEVRAVLKVGKVLALMVGRARKVAHDLNLAVIVKIDKRA
jgi:hypothetical protein